MPELFLLKDLDFRLNNYAINVGYWGRGIGDIHKNITLYFKIHMI